MNPERILIRGVNWLGDAVMTTPALLRLREARPGAHITLLTHEKLADLWVKHPALDGVLTFRNGEGVPAIGGRLRAEGFDLALVFPNSPRAALEVWLARIPRRIGVARPWRNFFLTQRVSPSAGAVPMSKRTRREIQRLVSTPREATPIPAGAHHLHHYLHLVAALGARAEPLAPLISVTAEEVAAVLTRFEFTAGGGPLFGLNAGAEYGPAKRWPRERFIEAAVKVQRQTNCHWWVFGGSADAELAADITTKINRAGTGTARCLAGQTSLRELCAALKACAVLLTNDTGPMHVAAAVGTPVVVPFGSTSPELTGPGLPGDPQHALLKSDAPCAPCFLRECPIDFRCMNGISVERVVQAVARAARPV